MLQSKKLRGLNDLLTYVMLLDEETVLHRDGALSQHFHYTPPDLESASSEELEAHSQTWQQALHFLGDGWLVETNVMTQPYRVQAAPQAFPELVSALIDDERRLQFDSGNYFESRYYISVTWKPKNLIPAKYHRFLVDRKTDELDLETPKKEFNRKLDEFIGYLRRSNYITPLKHTDLVSFLHRCLTGSEQGLAAPYQGAYLNTYLSSQDFVGGKKLRFGKAYIKTLAIDDLPSWSYPCLLNLLTQFPLAYRWSSRFHPLNTQTAQKYLKKIERSWSSKAIGLMGVIRESMGLPAKLERDAEQTAETVREAKVENASGALRFGFYNSVIVLRHENLNWLNQQVAQLTNEIQRLNLRVRDETLNATEAFLGSLPCHGGLNLRKMPVDTRFVSHALPMSQAYAGEKQALCPYYPKQPALLLTATQGNRPFWLNCHVNDVGHTAVLGPTGSGKSTLIAMLISAHRRYTDSRVIVLDKDYSHRVTLKALGGNYFDLSTKSCQLSPLARVTPENSDARHKAINWLTECCAIQGIEMTPERIKSLRESVERLAHEAPEYKNLTHLSVQDPVLREALNTYVKQPLLNGSQSNWQDSSILGFEMSSLISTTSAKRDLRLPVIKAIFNELEVLFQDKRPTLLVLEEAWAYLKHPLFFEKLTDWFKTLRKANVAVIFVSQDLSDIANSKAASIIQNSCMTRLYLPNPAAQEPAVKKFYQQFGLTDRQIEIIQTAQPKSDYYYNSTLGNRLFRLELHDIAQAFLCVSNKKDVEAFERLYQKNNCWVLDWLDYKGLTQWRDFVRKNYFKEEQCVSD